MATLPLSALRHRNYRLFFGGQLVSLVGTWMQSVAQSWLVYRLTGSTVLLGLLGFSSQVPVFFVAPFGGVLADRVRRHRILVTTQTISMLLAFVLAAVTLAHAVRPWHLFVLASSLGLVNAFDIPARQSFIVEMVGKDDLLSAIALNSSLVNGARILGPALAGITVAAVGEGWCFFLNGASFLAVIAGLLLMRDLPPPRPMIEASAIEYVVEGLRYVFKTPRIRSVLALLGLVSLTGMPYVVLMPVFAARILDGDARTLGMLMGSAGAGALMGAVLITLRAKTQDLERWIPIAASLFGAALVGFASSRWLPFSMVLLLPVGAGMLMHMSTSNTLLQTLAPDAMRGRVMSIFSMMFMGMTPFGALLAGFVARHVGPQITVAGGGLCCIAGALVFRRRLRPAV